MPAVVKMAEGLPGPAARPANNQASVTGQREDAMKLLIKEQGGLIE
jgi:hypothetical protein